MWTICRLFVQVKCVIVNERIGDLVPIDGNLSIWAFRGPHRPIGRVSCGYEER